MAEIKLNKRYKYAGDIFQKLVGIGFDTETATAFLNDIKDADVVEVKHGKWIRMGDRYANCSNCGTAFETLPTMFSFEENNIFCRHCGAKMD